ncbi:spinster family MFS transporter [Sphingobium sp. ZW T5_29]|uniref:spinster family MFS transporter n=1 Tax=Sphingobium sp. ZW T5_29 TaxID=3378077 RepID=UPI003853F6E7
MSTVCGSAGQGLSNRQANYALAAFLLAYVLSFVDRQILSLMVDPIRRDLDISDLQMGLLQGMAFALLYAILGVPVGLLADRWPRKWIITVGVAFWSAATALCGLASNYPMLFAARMAVGMGEATLSPSAHSFLSDAYPRHKLARAMAIYTLGITIGGGLALMIGGAVIDLVGTRNTVNLGMFGTMRSWQASFLIVASPGIIVAILVALVREPPRGGKQTPTMIAMGHKAKDADIGLRAMFAHFGRNPKVFASIYVSSCLLGVMGYGMTAWYPSLLIRNFGLSPGEAGRYLGLIFLILGSAGSVCGGLLSERMALRGRPDANLRVVAMAAAGTAIPATLAPLMPTQWTVLLLFAPACFFFNSYFGCAVAALQLATPPRMRATNSALFLLANSLIGLTAGSAIIPLLDRLFFGASGNIALPLALVAAIASTTAAVMAFVGRRAYGELASG